MKRIADTGLLVAAADSRDRHHEWAANAMRAFSPFHTCQAIVLETAWVLDSPGRVLVLLSRGDLVLDPAFSFEAEVPRLMERCRKPDRWKIWTVDRADFSSYRRNGRQLVPCEFPPD